MLGDRIGLDGVISPVVSPLNPSGAGSVEWVDLGHLSP
jgi:hypothetical protein